MVTQLQFLNILHVLNDGYQASFLLLLPFIGKELNMNLTQIGTLGTFFYAFETIFALPAGYFGEKMNAFKLIIIAMLCYGTSYLFLTFIHSYVLLIVFFVLAGIGFALFHPLAFALVAAWSPKNSTGRNMGDFTAIGDIGRIALSSLITFLAVQIGWRYASFLYSLLIFLFFLLLFLIFRKKKSAIASHETHAQASVSFADLIKNKRFILASLTALFDSAASSSLFIFLPFLLIKKGIDPAILGSFAAAYFVGNYAGKSVIGRLTDKKGSVKTFIVAEVCMALAIVLLTNANTIWFIGIISILLGALTKGTIPARATMAIQSVEHHGRYEKTVALLGFIASFGTTSALLLYGKTADMFGITTTFYLSASIALLAIIPAFLFSRINKTDSRR